MDPAQLYTFRYCNRILKYQKTEYLIQKKKQCKLKLNRTVTGINLHSPDFHRTHFVILTHKKITACPQGAVTRTTGLLQSTARTGWSL